MKYDIVLTSAFKKQLKQIKKRKKDFKKLDEIVDLLSKRETLPPKNRDHKLEGGGKFKDCHECHIEPDWLLVYRVVDSESMLLLVETGSHSDLF